MIETLSDMELLAPAGGIDQLRAAIRFGADAVYLATERFGMRARAANIALEQLPAAVAEAHAAGVKVHVTCNILMNDQDLTELPGYFRALEAAGVDALIISDMGAFALAREHAPSIELHVSTQASVANAAAARMWHALGAKRIVCAREMSVEEIKRMRAQIPDDLELEAFVHGAMCMAISGRCLISSHLNNRSANRGHCTQPCRWNYTLEEATRPGTHFPIEEDGRSTYIMNAQDLNMLEHLQDLADAGVCSIKIEGRNKKAFYVASVVDAYRRVLDGADAAHVAEELLDVSHRPYSTGFYYGPANQSTDYEGYEQRTIHVADVLACEPVDGSADDGLSRWRITARCRNRFMADGEIELLRPRQEVGRTHAKALQWLPEAKEGEPEPDPVPVEVANRATDRYSFLSSEPAQPGDFIRIREFRRAGRGFAN